MWPVFFSFVVVLVLFLIRFRVLKVFSFDRGNEWILSVAFADRSRLVCTTSGNQITVWNLKEVSCVDAACQSACPPSRPRVVCMYVCTDVDPSACLSVNLSACLLPARPPSLPSLYVCRYLCKS